jgi:photosystem II stability/assembly factor-like uncharacterized protein
MNKALAILLLTFFAYNAHAQSDTVWQMAVGNLPGGVSSMTWSSPETGFLLIPVNTISRTTDSGVTFTPLKFPTYTLTHIDSPGHSHLVHDRNKELTQVSDMAWPGQSIGIVAGRTSGDDTLRIAAPTILMTTDAGNNWTQYYPADTALSITRLFFTSPQFGWATGTTVDEKSFIAKTTDGGKTWKVLDKSTTYVYGAMSFKDDMRGLVLAQETGNNKLHVMSTYDGWASKTSVRISSSLGDSAALFAHWGNDSTWLVGSNGLQRTTDSGGTWTTVLHDDPASGDIAAGAFRDSVGVVVRDIYSWTHRTSDYGATWFTERLADSVMRGVDPDYGLHLLSMPTANRVYFLGQHPGDGALEVMKLTIAKPTTSTGGGGVAMVSHTSEGISLTMQGNSIYFTMNAAAERRTLEVLDLLGRTIVTSEVPSMATTVGVPSASFTAGSYFVRLGQSMVKFVVWN